VRPPVFPGFAYLECRLPAQASIDQFSLHERKSKMTPRIMLVAIVLSSLVPCSATAADNALDAAIASPSRTRGNAQRDGARHPAASLVFWGLKPGKTVIEVAPGVGGYWFEILAPYAKVTGGHYIAAIREIDLKDRAKFAKGALYDNVSFTVFGPTSGPLGSAGSADLVLTARNIHNWMWVPGMAEKSMQDFFSVLKPGGILAVEEHRADPRPQVPEARDGYVATATVVNLAKKAGFVLEASSEVNANPGDTKDHPFGVWTLPPIRRDAPSDQPANPNFDHAKYDAIGESDRMTLRFRKPS
jgi:predicted methyltransferase